MVRLKNAKASDALMKAMLESGPGTATAHSTTAPTQSAGPPPATIQGGLSSAATVPDNTSWNPKYGRLTSAEVQRMDETNVTYDLNYMRLHPEALDVKEVMQYFIALNNCGNTEIERALFNELDYPALAAYYKARAPQILASLPRTVTDVALYRYIGGNRVDNWRLWSKSLTLGQYDVQKKAFPLKYPGKDGVEIPDRLAVEDNHRDLSKACPTAKKIVVAASPHLPSSYVISIPPATYKELPMDEDAAHTYIDHAGPQRNVFLAIDATVLDTPPTITQPSSSNTQVTFQAKAARIRVIDSNTLKPLGTLYDDHTVTTEQAAAPAPTPPPASAKPANQWASSDHLYEIRQAVYISLAADACSWPLTAEQNANLQSFLQRVKNGKFNEREQYNLTDSVVRNAIAQQGRMNYCANSLERRDFDKAAAAVAPLGPIAAPTSK